LREAIAQGVVTYTGHGVISFSVELYGPHGAGYELDRLMAGLGPAHIGEMEGALAAGTSATEVRAHVITGLLKASVHASSAFTGDAWEGTIEAAHDPGIFELWRGDTPTKDHPGGGHYFFDPGGPEFERSVRQTLWDWVTDGDGGPAPSEDLGPWSGGD
jgi:hypothetical protein